MMQDLRFDDILSSVSEIKNLLFKYTKRVYIVGGALRDCLFFDKEYIKKLLDFGLLDIDIEVYDIKPDLFDEIMQSVGAKSVGKSFFVYKYKNYDIALARYENKVSKGHCGFEVKVCDDEQQGSKRRDFTINSLMLNIFSGELLDFWGGLCDLYRHKIKLINEKSFKEDSLRVLRAVVFASRFGFGIDLHTFNVCKDIKLDDLSRSRINVELKKIFTSAYIELGVYFLYKLGVFGLCFGVNSVDEKSLLKCLQNIKKSRQIITNPQTYQSIALYHITHTFNIDKKTLQKLGFDRVLVQKALLPPPAKSVKDLLKIALILPLKDYAGIDKWGILMAKKYGVYTQKLKLDFSSIVNDEDFLVKKEQFVNTSIEKIIKENSV